ncbi:MAG: hypothetical protein EA402_01795 [Planctomycetota bacterium]|nr:MAG: hypothetical protein EA402_01795 [Planctomycetota bacterium]
MDARSRAGLSLTGIEKFEVGGEPVPRLLAAMISANLLVTVLVSWIILLRQDESSARRGGGVQAVPVVVAAIERGSLRERRFFSGSPANAQTGIAAVA